LSNEDILRLHDTLSNWGRWGPDDQLGALNFITPALRAAASAEVRSGRTVSCGRRLATRPAPDNPDPVAHHMIGTATEGLGADYIAMRTHGFANSHIDALCHNFHDGHLYNGYPAESVTAHGARRLGIHHLAAGIVTRGVLLDIPPVRGVAALEPGTPIFTEDLDAAAAAAGVEVQTGDALFVRTGRWAWRDAHGPSDPHAMAGLDASCLPWLHAHEVATLGSDGISDVTPSRIREVSAVPPRPFPQIPDYVTMPIHIIVQVALGVHLLDNLDFDELATACQEEERWTFLLTVAPLILYRGTASPVNPVALF
jgi:kynurenine formamidase